MLRARTPLTPLELRIMKVLWTGGPATVQEVRAHLLAGGSDLAYNTVQTMLNVLLRKKRVRRALEGRAYRYRPETSRLQAARQSLQDLVQRMFDGSPERLVMSLVETRQLTPEKLAELSGLLDAASKPRAPRTAPRAGLAKGPQTALRAGWAKAPHPKEPHSKAPHPKSGPRGSGGTRGDR